MRIVFGDGRVSIYPCTTLDGEILLVFEDSMGCGEIGGPVPGREKGVRLSPDELNSASGILEFKNAESVDVVIDQLVYIKHLLKETEGDGDE